MYFQASPTPGVSYELELTIDGSQTATVRGRRLWAVVHLSLYPHVLLGCCCCCYRHPPARRRCAKPSHQAAIDVCVCFDFQVPFTAADCTPVSLLGAEFLSYNFTDHIKLYSAYNYTLTAVNSAGRSPPAAIPMQWDTIPSSWQGVIATPTMTPQDYIEFYGLSSISGVWLCVAVHGCVLPAA